MLSGVAQPIRHCPKQAQTERRRVVGKAVETWGALVLWVAVQSTHLDNILPVERERERDHFDVLGIVPHHHFASTSSVANPTFKCLFHEFLRFRCSAAATVIDFHRFFRSPTVAADFFAALLGLLPGLFGFTFEFLPLTFGLLLCLCELDFWRKELVRPRVEILWRSQQKGEGKVQLRSINSVAAPHYSTSTLTAHSPLHRQMGNANKPRNMAQGHGTRHLQPLGASNPDQVLDLEVAPPDLPSSA
jgi:hypothetical protein